jgi:protein O-GlcNAc transferase
MSNQGDKAMRLAAEHHRLDRLVEAERAFRQILEQQPSHIEATFMMGVLAAQTGRSAMAVDFFRKAVQLKPDLPIGHFNLGKALHEAGRREEAIAAYSRAIELKPNFVEALVNMGHILVYLKRFDQVITVSRRVLELQPKNGPACIALANALMDTGRFDESIIAFRKALDINPNLAETYMQLGVALTKRGLPDEAIDIFKKAMELKPTLAQIYTNAGVAYNNRGEIDESIRCCQRALELSPSSAKAHSNLIVTQNYSPDYTAKMLLEETQRWAKSQAQAILIQPNNIDRSPQRRLRIGYVSQDINNHPVGRFLMPLLVYHDHDNFEVHCYSDTQERVRATADARKFSDVWHDTAGLSDQALADQIRTDKIDILIDLGLHTGNRLLVFARKPAPIQATWLGYPGTIGLSAVDYRISDPYIDPIGQTESDYAEQTIRIPSYWCYLAIEVTPAVTPLPAEQRGQITFGCLNNFCKVSSTVLDLWAKLLNRTDNSRLIITSHPGQHRQRVKQWFGEQGIDPARIEFVDRLPLQEYLARYGQIDIALDTTPFAGGTTTCDALWMGVPVVTLSGQTAVGRSGVSLLSNVGLPELIARTGEQYVDIAAELAGDLPQLSELRQSLREKMRNSPLMDARRFTKDMEAAYRQIWRELCG